AAAGEVAALRDRHASFFLALAGHAAPDLHYGVRRTWLDRLDAEHDNLRTALRWFAESGDTERGLRLGGLLQTFWAVRGYQSEGHRWLQGALATREGASPAVRARALVAAGRLATMRADYVGARPLLNEGLSLFRALDDRAG